MGFSLRAVSKVFAARSGPVPALHDVSFTVHGHEFVSVVGPSGCGKTTLLRLISGLLRPTAGEVVWEASPPGVLRSALVFQEHGLLPWRTVLENVALGLELRGVGRAERLESAAAFIEQVGLTRFSAAFPHELSAGMRQRVGIARAFVADPEALLLDEPFGSLDAQTRLVLQEELLRIWREHAKLVVHVTHDIDEAILLSDRVLVMSGRPGRVREAIEVPLGRPRERGSLDRPEAAAVRRRVWTMLREEAMAALALPPGTGGDGNGGRGGVVATA